MQRKRPGQRHSRAQWAKILQQFESSSEGAREFCRQQGVSPSSFQRWRRRLGGVNRAEFVEFVPASQPAAPGADGWSLEVVLPNGVRLRFQG